jgi:hypothetical protein
MFVPHMKHIYEPPKPVTGLPFLFFICSCCSYFTGSMPVTGIILLFYFHRDGLVSYPENPTKALIGFVLSGLAASRKNLKGSTRESCRTSTSNETTHN